MHLSLPNCFEAKHPDYNLVNFKFFFRRFTVANQQVRESQVSKRLWCAKTSGGNIAQLLQRAICRYPIGFEPSRFSRQAEFQGTDVELYNLPMSDAIWNCVDQVRSASLLPLSLEATESEEGVSEERLKLATVPFIACGDLRGFDSETTYPLDVSHSVNGYSYL